jgi:hypothetical protein
VKRALLGLVAIVGLSCGGVPPIPDPAGFAVCVAGCKAPGFCVHGAEGWACVTPSPTPTPSPSPDCRTLGCPPGEECLREGRCGGSDCFSCFPIPTPTPTPSPTPLPTPSPLPTASPSPSPTPQPTPTPCVPTSSVQRVCVNVDGSTSPYTPDACWTWESYQGFMIRNGYYTAGDPLEDGDVSRPQRPGHWLNHDAQQVLVELIRKSDGMRINPNNGAEKGTSINPPYMEKRVVVTPCPSPTPGPSPSPGPSPTPGTGGGGATCTPLAHVGVALHNTVPAKNGPRKIAWRFSATPKSVKPFCPEHRNECEQQAYQGDPVGNYEAVVWRFDLRFDCQDKRGPVWNQQEPHTGSNWENTDVNSENPYLANLKPAVPGLHTVRTCVRAADGSRTDNCRTTTAVAP